MELTEPMAANVTASRSRGRGRTAPARLRQVVDMGAVMITAAVLWELTASTGWFGSALPGVGASAKALVGLAVESSFYQALGLTLTSWLLGLLLSILTGIPLGLLFGASRAATASVRLTVDFFRAVPPVVLIPLFLLVVGPTLQLKLLLIVSGAMWPLLIQSMHAIGEVDPVARETVRSMRLPWARRVLDLFVPSALPFLFTGVRLAAAFSLLFSLASELIADAPGIGREMGLAQFRNDMPTVFAYLMVAGALGVAINGGLMLVGRRVLAWHPSMRGAR
jgi:ABC-type nitrate/sulfonate/bicarbonate transport system permease component